MSLKDILLGGSGLLAVLLTVIEFTPIKVNPWSAIARLIGRAFNGEVLDKLEEVKAEQKATAERLDTHIRMDDERTADEHRARILQFNNELLRDIPHTKEEFCDVLADIDAYEAYCQSHPDYKNNRAVHAIANIGRVYDERLAKHDFL